MRVSDIGLYRLRHQHIVRQTFKRPDEVVAWLGAMQGQDYPGTKWSIGLRLPASTDAEIEQAITDKTILRTWVMRGTLHLVASADIRWMIELFAARIIAGSARRYKELELDGQTLSQSNTVLTNALKVNPQLSRGELFTALEQNGISTHGQRGVYMLQRASYDGLICQINAPRNTPVFVLLENAAPDARTMSRAEAIAELARRYFTSRGPVTVQDFAHWSGMNLTEARAGLDAVKGQLVHEEIGGQTYWLADDAPIAAADSLSVYALPGFDEYVLGYRDRSAVLEAQYANRICPGGNGVFYPTIVVNGRIVGIWKRTLRKDAVMISSAPFDRPLDDSEQAAFASASARYADFLGLRPVMA